MYFLLLGLYELYRKVSNDLHRPHGDVCYSDLVGFGVEVGVRGCWEYEMSGLTSAGTPPTVLDAEMSRFQSDSVKWAAPYLSMNPSKLTCIFLGSGIYLWSVIAYSRARHSLLLGDDCSVTSAMTGCDIQVTIICTEDSHSQVIPYLPTSRIRTLRPHRPQI